MITMNDKNEKKNWDKCFGLPLNSYGPELKQSKFVKLSYNFYFVSAFDLQV